MSLQKYVIAHFQEFVGRDLQRIRWVSLCRIRWAGPLQNVGRDHFLSNFFVFHNYITKFVCGTAQTLSSVFLIPHFPCTTYAKKNWVRTLLRGLHLDLCRESDGNQLGGGQHVIQTATFCVIPKNVHHLRFPRGPPPQY